MLTAKSLNGYNSMVAMKGLGNTGDKLKSQDCSSIVKTTEESNQSCFFNNLEDGGTF